MDPMSFSTLSWPSRPASPLSTIIYGTLKQAEKNARSMGWVACLCCRPFTMPWPAATQTLQRASLGGKKRGQLRKGCGSIQSK